MQSSHPKPPGVSAKLSQHMMRWSAQTETTGRSVRPASSGSTWGREGPPWRGPAMSVGCLSPGRGIRSCRAGSSVMHAAAGALCQTLCSGQLGHNKYSTNNNCLRAASGKVAGTLLPAGTVDLVRAVYTRS